MNIERAKRYIYFFRKLWEDQAHRQKLTKKELAEMLE